MNNPKERTMVLDCDSTHAKLVAVDHVSTDCRSRLAGEILYPIIRIIHEISAPASLTEEEESDRNGFAC